MAEASRFPWGEGRGEGIPLPPMPWRIQNQGGSSLARVLFEPSSRLPPLGSAQTTTWSGPQRI